MTGRGERNLRLLEQLEDGLDLAERAALLQFFLGALATEVAERVWAESLHVSVQHFNATMDESRITRIYGRPEDLF